ncbi:hypothetical protein MAPG_06705 [Magnaporthiopsis poae ATCC 64411]|uniref:Uncharacterized protein n=1 Tax=Magnaporthiopsis poae (strain ATCC 64411 / 73-15) TaxID=644358 RepID=A0A0C4E2R5_MAGP6|nr:hypothetical protein MAPG_06705 [Magnaporthiopsis poae ATCC 64411]
MDADDRWESIQAQMREADVRHHENGVRLSSNHAGLEVMVAENRRHHDDDIELLRKDHASLQGEVSGNDRRHNGSVGLLRKDHASLERRVSGRDHRYNESIEALRKDSTRLEGIVSDNDRRHNDSIEVLRTRCDSLEGAMAKSDGHRSDSIEVLARDYASVEALRRDCANLGDAMAESGRHQNDSIVLLKEDCASLEAAVAENDRRYSDTIEQLRRDCGSIERRCVDTEERLSSLAKQLDQHAVQLLQQQEQQQEQQQQQRPEQQRVQPPSPERRWQHARSPSPVTTTPTALTFPASPPPSQTVQGAPAAEINARSDDPPQTKPVRTTRRPRNRAAALAKELKSLGAGDEGRNDPPRKGPGVAPISELLFSFDKRYRHKKPSPEHRFVRDFLRSVHDVLPEHDRTRVEDRFLSCQRGVFYRRPGEEALWCSISAKWHDVRLCMWSFKEVRDVMMPNRAL